MYLQPNWVTWPSLPGRWLGRSVGGPDLTATINATTDSWCSQCKWRGCFPKRPYAEVLAAPPLGARFSRRRVPKEHLLPTLASICPDPSSQVWDRPAGTSKSCLSCVSVSTTDAAMESVPCVTFGIYLSMEKRNARVYVIIRTPLRLQDSLLFCQKRSPFWSMKAHVWKTYDYTWLSYVVTQQSLNSVATTCSSPPQVPTSHLHPLSKSIFQNGLMKSLTSEALTSRCVSIFIAGRPLWIGHG